MAKKKKKFYAIRKGNGVSNLILESWDECSKLVLGYNAEYKSFLTREEAEEYLDIEMPKEIKAKIEDKSKSNENILPGQIRIEKLEELEKEIEESKGKYRSSKKRSKKNKNKELLTVELPKNLHKDFMNKCTSLGMTEDKVIKNMIEEWLL